MAIPNLRNMINGYSRTPIPPMREPPSFYYGRGSDRPRPPTVPSDLQQPPKLPDVMVSPMRELVLKTQLHCEGCITKLIRALFKIKGVQRVEIYVKEDLVKVQGTMDAKELSACLMKKLNRKVEVVPLNLSLPLLTGLKMTKETNK